uniref:hypothetical protein n=1 Tax=Nocardia farcinica TaxID=37329 RepID=UPI001E46008E
GRGRTLRRPALGWPALRRAATLRGRAGAERRLPATRRRAVRAGARRTGRWTARLGPESGRRSLPRGIRVRIRM